jgi:Fic-DOC domain mobile mystery protein B
VEAAVASWLSELAPGATPLTPEEQDGLIPTHVTCRSELNELEQRNVRQAISWAFDRRRTTLLRESFVLNLHKRMFGEVWRWAGQYRSSPKNLGVVPWEIRPELLKLRGDTRYWLNEHSHPPDELAVRFHHRLVQIHPFPNGNGRLSRLMGDLMIVLQGGEPFSWGKNRLAPLEVRTHYINALRAADASDLTTLIVFARS